MILMVQVSVRISTRICWWVLCADTRVGSVGCLVTTHVCTGPSGKLQPRSLYFPYHVAGSLAGRPGVHSDTVQTRALLCRRGDTGSQGTVLSVCHTKSPNASEVRIWPLPRTTLALGNFSPLKGSQWSPPPGLPPGNFGGGAQKSTLTRSPGDVRRT